MSANKETIAQWIREKKTALGIEFGSTRIKAVLVGEDHTRSRGLGDVYKRQTIHRSHPVTMTGKTA